jgi:hypothetical protein
VQKSLPGEGPFLLLISLNNTCEQLSQHTLWACLKALFNFICNNLEAQLKNILATPPILQNSSDQEGPRIQQIEQCF